MAMDVLCVEDDPVLGKALQRGLTDNGMACEWTRDGREGMRLALSHPYEAVVLDLLLPDVSGLEILRAMRARGVRTPVLVLTALGSLDERVKGLDAGADDYLVKPFEFPELVARINAICRRSLPAHSNLLQTGPLTLDLSVRRVTREGREVELTPTEFSLLEFLMRHVGQVVTRRMLCEHLWDLPWEGVTNVIEVHINRLRNKIDRPFDGHLIQTVRGRGYLLSDGNS